jgi:hypothetical protein
MADIKKPTKNEILDIILEAMADNADVVEYCETEKASLAKKAAAAKARAEEKRAAGDELRAAVEEILKNATEAMTRDDILAAIDNAEELELTAAKVGNRASELVRYGVAHKVDVKVDKSTKVGYVYGPAPADAE